MILVTGARGFVGRAVVQTFTTSKAMRSLRSIKHRLLVEVRFLGRSEIEPATSPIERQLQEVVSRRNGLRELFTWRRSCRRLHSRDPVRATEVNVQGSLNLLELARQFGVRRFVFGSSLSVYGTCPPDELVSETNRAAPEDLYGAAKSMSSNWGSRTSERHSLQFVSLRIGRVMGPGAQSSTSAWRSEIFECLAEQKAIEIALPYIGSERMLVVHVDDVARMLVALMDAPRPEVLYLQLSLRVGNCRGLEAADRGNQSSRSGETRERKRFRESAASRLFPISGRIRI